MRVVVLCTILSFAMLSHALKTSTEFVNPFNQYMYPDGGVNLYSGDAAYSHHVTTVAGRGGADIDITLNYSSNVHQAVRCRNDSSRIGWLVMIREMGSKKIDFFISNAAETISLKSLVATHRSRYFIERSFQESKSTIGMADYQIRHWHAWHHHISLCMVALLFMLTLKLKYTNEAPLLSCTDIVLVMDH